MALLVRNVPSPVSWRNAGVGWQQKGNGLWFGQAGMSCLAKEGKIGSPGVASSSAVVGKLLFPPTEGPKVMPCRCRYLTQVFKVGAELSLNPAAVSGERERGAPPEENSDMSWDDLAPTDVCLHTCSPTGSDDTQKKSRICPWKPLCSITASVFA